MTEESKTRQYYFITWLNKKLTGLQSINTRKLLTFLFFVVISAIFWLVTSLGEQYEAEVTYPVKYTNFPENKVLIGKVPDKLRLRIRASGFSILKSRLNLNLISLKFNVNSFSLNSIGKDTFYVVTETVKDLLSAELNQVILLDISPDTLFFRFTNIAIKKVVVIPELSIHDRFFQKQYMQNGDIKVYPDSIIVSGPETEISSIHFVKTEPLEFNNLSDTVSIQCQIIKKEMINYSQERVTVTIPVDRFTEVEKNIGIIPLNVPDSLSLIPIPGQITITYRISLSNFNRIMDSQITPHIDYTQIQKEQVSRLNVFLSDTPAIISNIRLNPKEIEFLITRK